VSTTVVYNAEPLGFSPRARAAWQQLGHYVEGAIDAPALADDRARASVLIVRLARRIDATVLDDFPQLRALVSATTGLDHIDLGLLRARGIQVVSLRGETDFLSTIPSTAEHTMALVLALLRNVPAAAASVLRGEWERDRFRGRQLKGRTLGVVGLGRTGRMVAQYAGAFGARVAYFDPNVQEPAWARKDSLPDLLRGSEILSLHVHLSDTTREMIGARELDLLPRGARLINTSRGGLVDEQALVDRLRAGHLAGVAADVLANELEGIAQSPLRLAMCDGLPVILTPHIGGATVDAMQECEEFIAEKYRALAARASMN
jgi:D-3-phosphoglycerate dehydrogenase / 2-oxoglutarate reductase